MAPTDDDRRCRARSSPDSRRVAWPLVGGPIAGLFAYFAHQKGDTAQRDLALVAVAVALIVVILISFLPETWDLLLPWVNLQGPLPT